MPELEATFDTIVDAYLFFDKDKDGYVSKAEIIAAIDESSSGKKGNDQIGIKRFGSSPFLLNDIHSMRFNLSIYKRVNYY